MIANRGILRHGSWQAHRGRLQTRLQRLMPVRAIMSEKAGQSSMTKVLSDRVCCLWALNEVLLANDISLRTDYHRKIPVHKGHLAGGNMIDQSLSVCQQRPRYNREELAFASGHGGVFPRATGRCNGVGQ